MNKRFALCVVTYYPEDHLKGRLVMALALGYAVYVYDNTPGGCLWQGDADLQGVCWMGSKENDGMGKALQVLLPAVKSVGLDGAFYVDQDTHFTQDTLDWLAHWLLEHPEGLHGWGALNFVACAAEADSIASVSLMVSAGTLFNLKAMEVIGWHSAAWFLECVDYEWCGRALKAGYALGHVKGCSGLDHSVYQPMASGRWMGENRSFRLYPIGRSRRVVWGLLKLGTWGLWNRLPKYAWACYRNVFTHGADQLRALGLFFIKKWGLGT